MALHIERRDLGSPGFQRRSVPSGEEDAFELLDLEDLGLDLGSELDDTETSGDHVPEKSPLELLQALAHHAALGGWPPPTLARLHCIGVPESVCRNLAEAVQPALQLHGLARMWQTFRRQYRLTMEDAIAVWVAMLAQSPAGASLSTEQKDLLKGGIYGDRSLRGLRRVVAPLVRSVTADSWGTLARRPE